MVSQVFQKTQVRVILEKLSFVVFEFLLINGLLQMNIFLQAIVVSQRTKVKVTQGTMH